MDIISKVKVNSISKAGTEKGLKFADVHKGIFETIGKLPNEDFNTLKGTIENLETAANIVHDAKVAMDTSNGADGTDTAYIAALEPAVQSLSAFIALLPADITEVVDGVASGYRKGEIRYPLPKANQPDKCAVLFNKNHREATKCERDLCGACDYSGTQQAVCNFIIGQGRRTNKFHCYKIVSAAAAIRTAIAKPAPVIEKKKKTVKK